MAGIGGVASVVLFDRRQVRTSVDWPGAYAQDVLRPTVHLPVGRRIKPRAHALLHGAVKIVLGDAGCQSVSNCPENAGIDVEQLTTMRKDYSKRSRMSNRVRITKSNRSRRSSVPGLGIKN